MFETQAIGNLTLYANADGTPVHAGDTASVRPFDSDEWHSLTISQIPTHSVIDIGGTARVSVAFESATAKEAPPVGKPLYFGDRTNIRGLLVLEHYLDAKGAPLAQPVRTTKCRFYKRTEAQAVARLTLDSIESDGRPARPFVLNERPVARTLDGSSWYSFVVVEMDGEVLPIGESAEVSIAFVNAAGAKDVFPAGTTFRFGNGVTTRGSMTLHRYIEHGGG